jgi:hypothetical protein
VPGGEVVFQVMVDDGFDTAVMASEPVSVPHKPPSVAILSPQDGVDLVGGGMLRLWGAASDENGHRLPDEACEWLFAGKPIAKGLDLFVATPPPGEYEITLRTADRFGEAQTTHKFTVTKAPDQGN